MRADEHGCPVALGAVPDHGGIVHATAVSAYGKALLICGPAGSGKSSLALAMMTLDAGLIADDRTLLRPTPAAPPLASAPPGLPAAIEARGLGLLRATLAPPAPVAAVLDLARTESERLPPLRSFGLLGQDVRLLHNIATPHFPAMLMQYLREGFAPL